MCFSSKHPDGEPVSAGQTLRFTCEVNVRLTGPFESSVDVHLEDNGLRTITFTVRGVCVASKP